MDDLLPRLMELSRTLSRGRLYERAVADAGITLERPALTILTVLFARAKPARIGDIAAQMQVEGPHVTRHVQGLERRGLVERVVDPDDGRARLIAPTAAGREIAERYTGVVLGWFSDALADWPAGDRAELTRLLGKMIDDLTAHLTEL
jgi:DNA-binding MarR family transcriptional regulator